MSFGANIGVSADELWNNSLEWIKSYVDVNRNSVCASVTLQIDQRVTMTREAFRGTLTLHNGNETDAMKNVSLNLIIKDENRVNCNNLFQIETEKLTTLTGIDGNGSLGANSDGSATILFIPTVNAAPTVSKFYSFGGTLSYLDPFSGTQVTVDLFPVTLEVQPSPYLHLYYFMQRDILGDDPLTEPIEPSIPAELAVMVDNKGYGAAKNLTIESAQPRIIENEKGLLINFALIGSSLNGRERQLGLTDINFGDLPGRSQAVGQWWLTSSLLGHFTSYQSRLRHLDSRGNPDLSLVDSVEIHELIRSITAYGDLNDGISDFLVNDIPDAHDYPDAIYFSNATKTKVVLADTIFTDNVVTELNPVIDLTVKSSSKGWNYARIDDPGQGRFRLERVMRDNNQEIPITNVWQTQCTLRDGAEPIYENKLHLVDTFSVAGLVNYTLTFEKVNANPLQVDSITGVPTVPVKYPLEKVAVHFNKPVYEPTFTWRNMELRFQGGNNIMDSTVTTTRIDDSNYYVNFAKKTQATGYYVFTVHTNEIYDMDNLPGELGKRVSWIQQITPVDTVIVQAICEGDSYNFNGKVLTETGAYQDMIKKWNGSDSIVQFVLIVNPVITTELSKQICFGSSYPFFGTDLTASGVYEYILKSIQGCDSVIRLNLTVFPEMKVDLGGDRIIRENETIVIDAGEGFTNYLWSTGATTQIETFTNDGKGKTEIVWVEVMNGICSTSNTIKITFEKGTTTIIEAVNSNSFRLYPNPTRGRFTIEFNQAKKRDIKIYTLIGQMVYHETHGEKMIEMNLSGAKDGIYIVAVDDKERSKLIVSSR